MLVVAVVIIIIIIPSYSREHQGLGECDSYSVP